MEPKVRQRCFRCAGLGSCIPCGDLTKDIESVNTGLVLYDYFLDAEKTRSGQNVYIILQNKKDVTLSSWKTERSFEKCIDTCPRCINIYKRAKRLLKNISTLGKRTTLGVCSNCGIKIQTDSSHCKCNVIFKKFLTPSAKDLEIDERSIKTSLSKPNRCITGVLKNEAGNNRLKLQTHWYSDSYLNRASKKYYGQRSSQKLTNGRQVKIRPLFQSEIDLSKLYITRTCLSLLQKQTAISLGQQASPTLGFRKTRLRLRKQPRDQAYQFHFIFPSEKKDLNSRPQVSSSELLHDIQVNRKKYILEKKNISPKTKKQTLPWQRDFSISSLQGKSIELLHGIHAKYREIKTLEDEILEERHSRDLEKKNLGAKTNKQTLPWQSDFSLFSLEGQALELLHDIRAKYMDTKKLEDKILELGKKNLGAKLDKRILPWESDSPLLGLEGDYLELLHEIRGKYMKTKIRENKILAKRRSSDLEMKIIGVKRNKRPLSWQRDSSLIGLEGDSLEVLHEKRGKYTKTKILENKILAKRSSDLKMKNFFAKTNKQTSPWDTDSSLLSLKETSLELLNNIQTKYENKKRRLELIVPDEKKSLGTKTEKHRFSWQKHYSLLSVEAKYEEKKGQLEKQRIKKLEKPRPNNYSLVNLETKYEEKEKHLEEQRNRVLEKKIPGAKSKKYELPRQNNYSLLKLEAKHEEKQIYSEEQRNRDLEKNVPSVKTKKHESPRQKDYSLLNPEVKYKEKQKHAEQRCSKDLEMKKLGAKTKKHGLPWQKNSSLLSIKGDYEKKKMRLEDQLGRDLERTESKKYGTTTKKYKLPWKKKDSGHLNLEGEPATIKQANVIIGELPKRYHKKKYVLNKKEDSFNELTDSNSEINVRLVRKTSKEIEERRKKNQAILEMLTRMDRNNISGTSLATSHRRFLDTDSTELPIEKAIRKMNVYRMVLSRPEFDWFAKNKDKRKMFYDSGEVLADFSENGRCRWFYRDGKLALDYYNTERTPPGRRYVVYSSGKPNRKGRPRPQTILASFDHSGNAVVFDHAGNIRLKYDQNEGVVLDPSIGPESHWKWHSLNDPPVANDTEMPFMDPEMQMSEEDALGKETEPTHKHRVHKIKLKKSVYEKSKKKTVSYKHFEIKMKALKINENFSLKILDQAKVYLIYRDDTTHIKINIGMALNRMEIVDIETCYVGDVFNPLEEFRADTQSIVELQRTVAQARRAERARVRRQGRLMRPRSFVKPQLKPLRA